MHETVERLLAEMATIRRSNLAMVLLLMGIGANGCVLSGQPSATQVAPTTPGQTDTPSSWPMATTLPSPCPSPTLKPPVAILETLRDTAQGLLGGYSWFNGSEGVDATGLIQGIAPQLTAPVQAHAQERLTVRVVGDCPVTAWSVRAYDPADVSRSPQELAREAENPAGQAVVFGAPERDAVIEVNLRFGSQGHAAYYWLVKVAA
jgi:hypothetical protein